MNETITGSPDWTDVEACSLPTVERPLRLAEFDDLFAETLHTVEPAAEDTRVRLLLRGGEAVAEVADRTRRLADVESSCCSFFTLRVGAVGDGLVALDIEVPPAYADVLAGLVARAESARGAA